MWRLLTILSLAYLANAQYFCHSTEFGKLYATNYRYPSANNPVLSQAAFDPFSEANFRAATVVAPPNFDPITTPLLATITNWYTPAPVTNFLSTFSTFQSLRYSGIITPDTTGPVNFTMRCDDGCRMFLDGLLIVDMWKSSDVNSGQTFSIVELQANTNYTINIEYFQASAGAGFVVYPISLFQTRTRACIPEPTPKGTTCNLAPRGLTGEFYNNDAFTGSPIATQAVTSNNILSFNFTAAPAYGIAGIPVIYSVKFTGLFVSPFDGDVYFWARGSEYCKILIGGVNVLEFGSIATNSPAYRKGSILVRLEINRAYDIEIWYANTNQIPALGNSQMFFGVTNGRSNTNDKIIVPSMLRACLPFSVIAPEVVIVTEFDPSPIPVVLSLPPSGPVNVTFTLEDGVTVSPCMLYFTPENWNVTQYLYAKTTINNRRVGYITEGFEYTGVDNTPTTLTFTVPVGTTKKCTSWGDPHFITFSGLKYDFFGVGDFYLYRSLDSSFIVQARHFPCGLASCNGGFAIRYFDAVVIIYIAANVPQIYENVFIPLATGYSRTNLANGYILNFPNGISADIQVHYWGQGKTFYMDIVLTVPDRYGGQSRGLCGTHDLSKSNDYVFPNGTISTDLGLFTESWEVPFEENIFEEDLIPIGPLPGAANTGSPSTQLTNCTVPIPPEEERPPIDPPPNPPGCPEPIPLSEAEAFCLDLFNTSDRAKECASAGVDTNALYENCVDEVFLLCDYQASTPVVEQLDDECPTPPDCDPSCYVNGECVDGNCLCDPGFEPPSCLPNICPTTEFLTPNYGAEGDVIIVSGTNFNGGTVYTCLFGETSVPATFRTNFEISCVVPFGYKGTYIDVAGQKDGEDCSTDLPKFNYTSGPDCPPGTSLIPETGKCVTFEVIAPPEVCHNSTTPASIPVRLSVQPSENVVVTFELDNGVTVETCSLTFTPANWNVDQVIYAKTTVDGAKITYISNGAQYTGVTNNDTSLCLIELTLTPTRTCTSWGDPHFVTFSNKNYDFHGLGSYYLYKSIDESFIVQSMHFGCAPNLACNWAFAIRFNGALIVVSLDSNPYSFYESPFFTGLPGYSKALTNKKVDLVFPNNFKVTITRNFWTAYQTPYLNIYIESPNFMEGNTEGLCGTQDSNKNNDFITPMGKLETDLNTFGKSWAVPPAENLFLNDNAVIPSDTSYPTSGFSTCGTTPSLPPRTPPSPPAPNDTPISCSLTAKEIMDFCNAYFLDSPAAKNCENPEVDLQAYADACINDVTASCDFSAAGPAAGAFDQVCPTPNLCPDNCNFNGKCIEGICQCNGPEFELPDCSPLPPSCDEGFEFIAGTCVDINECETLSAIELGCVTNAYCVNTEGSYTCDCLPGFVGTGFTSCDPDQQTTIITPFGPIARFLFDGNLIDSSGNDHTIDKVDATFVPFYHRGFPENEALLVNRNEMITDDLPLDRTITIAILFRITSFFNSFNLIQLKANPTDTEDQALLTISVLPTGKFQWKRFGTILGTSFRYLLTGRNYFFVATIRNGQILNFIEDVQIGTFNLAVPGDNYNLKLAVMNNFIGHIDEVTVYDQPVFSTNFRVLNSLIRCQPVVEGCALRCYNDINGPVCGELLLRYSNN